MINCLQKTLWIGIAGSAMGLMLGSSLLLPHVSDTPRAMAGVPKTTAQTRVAVTSPGQIAEREYWISRDGDNLQAPNRANDLRSYFSGQGVTVTDRESRDAVPLVKFNYQGVYRGGERVLKAPTGEVSHQRNRVEIRRGEVLEWYVNTPQGLEQGFDIARRPAGAGELSVRLNIEGARFTHVGEELSLRTEAGRGLRYGKLKVLDAEQGVVPSSFKLLDAQTVALVVDDGDAVYPLSIDPLLSASHDWIIEGDQVNAHLGEQIVRLGDVNGDGFDDFAVASRNFDLGEVDEGVVMVFHGSSSGPSATPNTILQGNESNAHLGLYLAGLGDINGDGFSDLYIRTSLGVNGGSGGLLYHGSASGIANGDPSTANAQFSSAQFSGSMSMKAAGDVNGDDFDDVLLGANPAFVVHGSALGLFTQANVDGTLSLSLADTGSESAASAGDVNNDGYDDIVVTAPNYGWSTSASSRVGAAYVFHGSPSGVGNRDIDSADGFIDLQYFVHFGPPSVKIGRPGDLNGDGYSDVVLGISDFIDPFLPGGSAMRVFHGSPGGIGNPAEIDSGAGCPGASWGLQIDATGDFNGDGYSDLAIGSVQYWWPNLFGQIDDGSVDILFGAPMGVMSGLGCNGQLSLTQPDSEEELGHRVRSVGDVNGDGFDDLLVTARRYSSDRLTQDWEGAVYLFLGNLGEVRGDYDGNEKSDVLLRHAGNGNNYLWFLDGVNIVAETSLRPVRDTRWQFVASGDYNGDGKSGVFMRHSTTGRNYMWLMNGGTIAAEGSPRDIFDTRWRVVGGGDYNGDGKSDVFLRNSVTGANYIWLMDGIGVAGEGNPRTVKDTNWQVVADGDFNGDGKDDVFLRNSVTGANYIWLMDGTAIATEGSVRGLADTAWKVVGDGDYNGDGRDDLFWRHTGNGNTNIWLMSGNSILGEGSPQNLPILDWKIVGDGDYDGDGKADVFVRNSRDGRNFIWLMDGLTIKTLDSPRDLSDTNWRIVH